MSWKRISTGYSFRLRSVSSCGILYIRVQNVDLKTYKWKYESVEFFVHHLPKLSSILLLLLKISQSISTCGNSIPWGTLFLLQQASLSTTNKIFLFQSKTRREKALHLPISVPFHSRWSPSSWEPLYLETLCDSVWRGSLNGYLRWTCIGVVSNSSLSVNSLRNIVIDHVRSLYHYFRLNK